MRGKNAKLLGEKNAINIYSHLFHLNDYNGLFITRGTTVFIRVWNDITCMCGLNVCVCYVIFTVFI